MIKRSMMGKERMVVTFPSQEDCLFMLGRVNYTKAHPPIEPHDHQGMMEIVLIAKGKQIYTVGGNEYTVESGEVFVTYPNELHSTANYPEDKLLLYYMIIDPEKLKTYSIGVSTDESGLIQKALKNMKRRAFKGTDRLKFMLDDIFTACDSNSTFRNTIIRNLASNFIIHVAECERMIETVHYSGMQSILDYIDKNIYEDISVSMLSEIAQLSLTRFQTNFRREIGIPPREYVLRRKIEIAKGLLINSDLTITEVAYKLSFASSQYFSTVFKRYTLMRPKDFLNRTLDYKRNTTAVF